MQIWSTIKQMTHHPIVLVTGLLSVVLTLAGISPRAPIGPIPDLPFTYSREMVIGQKLFSDESLHPDSLSCASCHQYRHYSTQPTRLPSHETIAEKVQFNVPSLLNTQHLSRYGWLGQYDDLAAFMDYHFDSDFGYAPFDFAAFSERYATDFSEANLSMLEETFRSEIIRLLVIYMHTLNSPDARFDRYLQGELSVLSEQEVRGYELFREYGCQACHQGINLGGNLLQKIGIYASYERSDASSHPGLIALTGHARDQDVFRVPPLRNITETGPYFHDGSMASIETAIEAMAKYQVGRDIPKQDIEDIVAFLKTLTGDMPVRVSE